MIICHRTPAVEEKKTQIITKPPALEKKQPERRIFTKENKEPKEVKDMKGNNISVKEEKDNKEKEKEKETPKVKYKNDITYNCKFIALHNIK